MDHPRPLNPPELSDKLPHPAFEELQKITQILDDDIEYHIACLQENPSAQVIRRAYIRVLFTRIEGHLFAFKQTMLALEQVLCPPRPSVRVTNQWINLFSEAERMILREREYRIRGGDATEETSIIHLRENLKFTFKLYQRALGIPIDDLVNGPGFENLIRAQAIRNRLTHPKSGSDLEVTDNALQQADLGSNWYFDAINLLLDRSAVESTFYCRFSPAPTGVTETATKLIESGAMLKTLTEEIPIGMMKQISNLEWFYWSIDYDLNHQGGILKARAYATSDEQGLLVDFIYEGISQELRPMRWVINEPQKRDRFIQKHKEWIKRWRSDTAFRAAIEKKATAAKGPPNE